LATARAVIEADLPTVIVTDWPSEREGEERLALVREAGAIGVFVCWTPGSPVRRVIAPLGTCKEGHHLWVGREIASHFGCPVEALRVTADSRGARPTDMGGLAESLSAQAKALGISEIALRASSDTFSGIVEHVRPDDLIVVGAPSRWRIPFHLAGSIPYRLGTILPNPTIMVMERGSGASGLRDVFWHKTVYLGLEAADSRSAIQLLVERLIANEQVPPHLHDRMVGIAMKREEAMPTSVGNDTALPHIALPGCTGIAGCLGIFPGGVDFGGGEGPTTRFVFLLITPETYCEEYLGTLAGISARMISPVVRAALASCRTPDAALRVLHGSAPPSSASIHCSDLDQAAGRSPRTRETAQAASRG
jgi:mannitol/fructose-specific phosphotransferase system IIA component (Ntr-type)